ncbi:TerB family tellurite resistance protein [Flavobacterium sp. I-SCBP12n]|uniref:TerB family tellurite resistance protein n=2 Tax=Flavobacterium TaxID=237 RepID=A0A9X1XSQ5_9FLAO|nr:MULTISPECIES: TerB family tellurite resistance protein [Flavobacterium]MBP4140847.1 TerB family tellurite resistance protein [Flavobacterium flabelliforme]MCK8142263.1 TerB family tellurite resistance protein [Flavobacterium pygoscelis]
MSFSDLFDSGFKQRNQGHFSAIVRVALTDGKVSPEEKAFLDKLAIKLEISPAEYEEILENPLNFPINAPYLHEQRLDRLFDLVRMIHVDHHLGDKQELLLRKICIALGFNIDNVDYIVNKSLKLADKEVDLETFLFEMQNMNK